MSNSGRDGRDFARLKQFVRELPAMERLILQLRFADDLRPVEIEQVTGLSERIVISVLRRLETEAGALFAERRAASDTATRATVPIRPKQSDVAAPHECAGDASAIVYG